MKYKVRVLWCEIVPDNNRWIYRGRFPVFNWANWKWVRPNTDEVFILPRSPFEWPDFWAGVLDVLLADKNDSQGKGMPPSAVVFWERQGEFVRIGVIREPFNESPNKAPAWFNPPSS